MSTQLDKTASKLDQVGSKMQSVGKSMTMNVTAPIVGLGAAMFKTFADYEDVMAELQARTQATGDEMEAMGELALQMGRDSVFSATEASQAMLELTSSGSSAAEAMEQLPHVLNLAAAGALELGAAADGVTDILAQFNLEAEQAEMVADNLAKAAGSSSATVSDLIQAFSKAGPVAKQFGLSVEQTAAALAVFAENGVKGSEAGTQLKSMLLNMSRTTAKTKSAWADLGVSMFDSMGNMRDIDDIFKDINIAMADMPMDEQIRLSQDLAGSYGIVGFNSLRAANGIDGMMNSMSNATGAAEVAKARMNTLSGQFKSLMGSLETLGIVLGGLGEGPLVSFIEMLTNTINKVTEFAQANPKLAQGIMIFIAAIATIGPVLVILGSLISAFSTISAAVAGLGAVIPFITGLSASFMGLASSVWAVLAPIAPLILALAALGAALMWWQKSNSSEVWANNFKMLGQIIQLGTQKILASAKKFGQELPGHLNNIGSSIQNNMQKSTNALSEGTKAWGGIFQNMGALFDKLKVKVVQTFVDLAPRIANAMKAIIPALRIVGNQIMQGLIDGVKSKIASFLNMVKDMAENVANAVQNALGIRSPSRVMMKLGEQTVAGFNKGMASTGGGINVGVPSASQMQGGLAPALSTSGIGSNTNQTFNIQAAPGTTDQQVNDIARKLAKLVQKR